LDFLGFPWIPSSESRLFNGLRGIFAQKFFSRLFRRLMAAAGQKLTAEAIRKRRLVHGAKLNLISDFLQWIVVRAVGFRPRSIESNPPARA
jgi:hypothetical protein